MFTTLLSFQYGVVNISPEKELKKNVKIIVILKDNHYKLINYNTGKNSVLLACPIRIVCWYGTSVLLDSGSSSTDPYY